jgi:hypothetical protein
VQFFKLRVFRKLSLMVAVVVLHGFAAAPIPSHAESWTVFRDADEQIQFMSMGTPEKSKLEGKETTTVVWHFENLDDGTNGYVDATRLKEGSFADFDVMSQAAELRAGVEKSGKTEVIDQRQPGFSETPTVELWTKTLSPQGNSWFGVIRMFVVGDTLYTLGLNASSLSQLEQDEAQAFLDSLKLSK